VTWLLLAWCAWLTVGMIRLQVRMMRLDKGGAEWLEQLDQRVQELEREREAKQP